MSRPHAPAAQHRPWLPYSAVLRERFGCRVQKICIDAGFTCPNIDGTLARGGCTYCNNVGFSPGTRSGLTSVREQVERGRVYLSRRYGAKAFIAYFQAYTNTHGRPLEELKQLYDEALNFDDIVGLAVGTRPDCVPDAVLDLLASYQPDYDVMLELGLQTVHDHTLERINRWHTFDQFADAVERAQHRELQVCAHVILGLPGETHADMMLTADRVADFGIDAIKIHLLHILRGTAMAKQYAQGEIAVFKFEEYVHTVADFLERLPADMAVERLTADGPPDVLIAPIWANRKHETMAAIETELHRRGTCQGGRCAVAGGGRVRAR